MTKQEIEELLTDPELEFTPEYEIEKIESIDTFTSINGYIALPIELISVSYETNNDIEILDENGNKIGILCNTILSSELSREYLTEFRYYSYLIDSSREDFNNNKYSFSHNYLFVKEEDFNEYKNNYMQTSLLWGKFKHININEHSLEPLRERVLSIRAIKKLNFPTEIHKEIAQRALIEPYGFERFLKSYHLIELISDYYFVQQIKQLNDDLYGIGNLLSGYDSKELNKLRIIIKDKIINIDKISYAMENIKNYAQISKDIFQKYNKVGNPLKDTEFDKLLALSDFSESTMKLQLKIIGNDYVSKMLDLATYWIYRIRCSIAHSKIGEYIFKLDEEEFIINFSQKLIDAIILELLIDDT